MGNLTMVCDPNGAAIIRLRLDIGQLLDTSAALSFLHSAHFRIEMMRALDDFDHHRIDAGDTLVLLQDLKERVAVEAAAAPVNPHRQPAGIVTRAATTRRKSGVENTI